MRLGRFETTLKVTLLAGAVAISACDDDDDDNGEAEAFSRTNLVSNVEVSGVTMDPNLVDPWGMASGPDTFLWVVNRGSGTATVYDGDGNIVVLEEEVDGDDVTTAPLVVRVPPPLGVAPETVARPTAIIHNPRDGFDVPVDDGDRASEFIIATGSGTIAGWVERLEFEAELLVDTEGAAAYTGLAMDTADVLFEAERLYAVDFLGGRIDVFEEDLELDDDLADDPFIDPELPEGMSPFSATVIDGDVYVAYARVPESGLVPEPGSGGVINVFEDGGSFDERLVTGQQLDGPVAIAEAPGNFGPFDDAVIVGNSGDGRILAFDKDDGRFLGPLRDADGNAITINGLRGLRFGNGDEAGERNQLFFTASRDGGEGGLLGRIEPTDVNGDDRDDDRDDDKND